MVTLRTLLDQAHSLPAARLRERLDIYLRGPLPPPEQAVDLAHALERCGDPDAAAEVCARLNRSHPNFAPGWARRSDIALSQRRHSAALEFAARAVSVNPNCGFSRLCHGIALRGVGRVTAATAELSTALAINADSAPAWSHYGLCLADQFQHELALSALQRAVQIGGDRFLHWSNWLMTLQYDPKAGSEILRHAAGRFGAAVGQPRSRLTRRGSGPIRVGYLSPDIYSHPVGRFLLPILRNHDRDRFRISIYADSAHHDEASAEAATLADWTPTAHLDDAALARQVENDEVDVVVDLAGHTGGNRLPLLARRIAPVQLDFLGYCGSTGLANIDGVILGESHCGAGTTEYFTEPVITVSGTHFAARMPDYLPAVEPVAADHPRLASFNNTAKLNGQVIACWSDILKHLPTAILTLCWRSLADMDFQGLVRARFAGHGVDPDRLRLLPASDHLTLLQRYNAVDLALDPFPFSGGMNTFEALTMGVPVVTLPWERPISRQSAAILCVIGMAELIAATPADYVRRTVALLENPSRLRRIKRVLPDRMREHNRKHASRLAGELETIYADCLSAV